MYVFIPAAGEDHGNLFLQTVKSILLSTDSIIDVAYPPTAEDIITMYVNAGCRRHPYLHHVSPNIGNVTS